MRYRPGSAEVVLHIDPSGGARRSYQAATKEVGADAARTIHQAATKEVVVDDPPRPMHQAGTKEVLVACYACRSSLGAQADDV